MKEIMQFFKDKWTKNKRILHEKHMGSVPLYFPNKKRHLPKIYYVAPEVNKVRVKMTDEEYLRKQVAEINRLAIETEMIIAEMPNSLGRALKYLRKKARLTQEELAENSSVSVKTVRRVETEPDYKTTKINIAKICIGLELNPIISQSFFDLTEFKLSNSTENVKIKIILYDSYLENISEALLLLEKLEIKTK